MKIVSITGDEVKSFINVQNAKYINIKVYKYITIKGDMMMNKKLEYFRNYLTCLAEDQHNKEQLTPLYEKQGNILYELSEKVNYLIVNGEVFFILEEVFEVLEIDKAFQDAYLEELPRDVSWDRDILEISNLEGGKAYYVSEGEIFHKLFPESKVTLAVAYINLQKEINRLLEDVEAYNTNA